MRKFNIRNKVHDVPPEEAPQKADPEAVDFKELLAQNVKREQPFQRRRESVWVSWLSSSPEFRWACVALLSLVMTYFILPVPIMSWSMLLISAFVTLFAMGRLVYSVCKISSVWGFALVVVPSVCLAFIALVADPESFLHRALFKVCIGCLFAWPAFACIFVIAQFERVWRSVLLGIVSFAFLYGVPIAFENIRGADMQPVRKLQVKIENWDLKEFMQRFDG